MNCTREQQPEIEIYTKRTPKWFEFDLETPYKKPLPCGRGFLYGDPKGIRTPVVGSKVRSPRPLDDGVYDG